MRRGGKSGQKEKKEKKQCYIQEPFLLDAPAVQGFNQPSVSPGWKKKAATLCSRDGFFIENMGQVSSQKLQGGAPSQNPPLRRRFLFISRLYLEVRKGSQLQSAFHTEDGK